MSTKSLYAKSDFSSCGVSGTALASVDLTDSEGLRDMLRALKTADVSDLDYDSLMSKVLVNFEHKFIDDGTEAVQGLMGGDALVFLDKLDGCVLVNVRKYETRSIAEPPTGGVTKGPREGFIENMKSNLSMIERKLRTTELKIEHMTIGRRTSTDIAIVSIDGIADPEVIERIKKRLKAIDIDGVLDTHYLQSYLEPRPYSIFNQIGTSEKPDIIASKLLEGRVAVLCDGSPMVLTLPFVCFEDVQSSEDYYERSTFASFLRVVRVLALMLGVFLPGFYVSLEIFHFSVLPLQLLLTVMNATKGVPFPPLAEVLFVIFLFEIIREAGIRMPQSMGLAMSVVGALVLGDTAVKAGMIGSPAVMIVALSSIATYTVPNAAGAAALLRVLFTIVGGLLGLYGLLVCGMILMIYLVGMNGYGAPYLAPFAPNVSNDKKDGLLKTPVVDIMRRPESFPNTDGIRQKGSEVNNG